MRSLPTHAASEVVGASGPGEASLHLYSDSALMAILLWFCRRLIMCSKHLPLPELPLCW